MCKIGIYLVCDYPDRRNFFEAVEVCEKYDIDFLEIGFPFSDPVADGHIIEKAAMEVLKRENTDDFFESLSRVRSVFSKKLYVMTYANVIFGYNTDEFAKKVKSIDGVIIADLPFCETGRFDKAFNKYDIGVIRFVTPESNYEDIEEIKKNSKDFIYFVSTRGTTGGEFSIDNDTALKIKKVQDGFKRDVILGFGIKSRDDVAKACRYADGVVIGTRSIEAIEDGKFEEFILSLR